MTATETINYQTGEVVERDALPGPGVYFDMDDPTYFALPYISKSLLWRVHTMPGTIRTIQQARAWVYAKTEPTHAMRLGRAFDDCLSYGEGWRDRWMAYPINEKTGKAYGGDTKKVQDFLAEHGENALADEDFDEVEAWRDALLSDPDAAELFLYPGAKFQAVVIAPDRRTGEMCKGKIDLWTVRDGVSTHVDFKTWTKRRPEVPTEVAFGWECEDRGHLVQAATYLDNCVSLDELEGRPTQNRDFAFAAVNKSAVEIPGTGERIYEVTVVDVTEHQVEVGQRIRDELIDTLIAIRDGHWKPKPKGRTTMVLSNRMEDNYGGRP